MPVTIENLEAVADRIREDFETRNSIRDNALHRTRELIRLCGNAIRASHRDEWADARDLLRQADSLARRILQTL